MLRDAFDGAASQSFSPDGSQLADDDYQFLCRLIYEKSRIHLGADKKVLVASRLAKRLRHLGLPDYRSYCEMLRSPAGEEELRDLIDRISTNHTHFYREMKHFDFLKSVALPALRAKLPNSGEVLRVWSAASSSGEEPYTLAIHLSEHYAPATENLWQIEGTDISTRVLEIARQGVYEEDRVECIGPELVRRYFQKGVGKWQSHFRVKEELREHVRLHHLNLLEGAYPFTKPFHIIFCRNVMIYFDRPTQEDLVNRLSAQLLPGGYLMVGHSESLSGVKHSLKLVQPAIYVKPAK